MPDEHRYDHPLAVSEIIMHSSNIGAAQLGMQLGEQRLYDYARAFGYGERSGFPFGGEIPGILNRPSTWSDLEITRIPAGYSVSATPMQIHFGMSVIANGGLLMRPQLISEVHTPSGELVYRFASTEKRRVVSQKTAETMAAMLMGVVSAEGTAPDAAIPNFQVAGKTGTAQKLVNGHYSPVNHVGSFVGFFPAIPAVRRGEESSAIDQIAISVIVDDAKVPGGGSAYGRVVAAPSFKHLGEQLIQYLNIKPVKSAPARNLVALEGVRR
jgi:cell division protein FtsI (penicillin-binding protein 3)